MDSYSKIGVGLLGCGNVGGALAQLLLETGNDIARRTGIQFELRKVAMRSPSKDRAVELPSHLVTDDAASVVNDPSVDVVVELIGGIEPARTLIAKALSQKKPVITANKELMANVGGELVKLAADNGVDLLYEAAVGGGIPLVRSLRQSLAGERITRAMGIVNGTTNYILTRMTEDGVGYGDALVEAQGAGYAERDPTADVEGYDAAAKAAILANVAFGASLVAGDVYREGISTVTQEDIQLAARLGFVVKLLAVIELGPDDRVGARVHPTMVPDHHPLASVRSSFNALFVEGETVGDLMFYGRGAGGGPTASAVLGDLIDAAHHRIESTHGASPLPMHDGIWPIDQQSTAFYMNIEVDDRPGVLAAVASVFGLHNVSIRSMEQTGFKDEARLIFITHSALERDVQSCLHDLRALPSVRRIGNVMRVLEN